MHSAAKTSIATPRHKHSWKGPARRWHVHCPSRAGPFFDDTTYRPSPPKYPSMAAISPDSGTTDGSAARSASTSALVIDDARPVDSRCNS